VPVEILLGGVIASALVWLMGSALAKVWAAHKKLVEKVEDNTIRIVRIETLVIGKDQPVGDE
jgi:hypothetical protein